MLVVFSLVNYMELCSKNGTLSNYETSFFFSCSYASVKNVPKSQFIRVDIFRPETNSVWLPNIRRLLYDVYIKEQDWIFDVNNPSGITADRANGLFDNKFTRRSTWFLVSYLHAFGLLRENM